MTNALIEVARQIPNCSGVRREPKRTAHGVSAGPWYVFEGPGPDRNCRRATAAESRKLTAAWPFPGLTFTPVPDSAE